MQIDYTQKKPHAFKLFWTIINGEKILNFYTPQLQFLITDNLVTFWWDYDS